MEFKLRQAAFKGLTRKTLFARNFYRSRRKRLSFHTHDITKERISRMLSIIFSLHHSVFTIAGCYYVVMSVLSRL